MHSHPYELKNLRSEPVLNLGIKSQLSFSVCLIILMPLIGIQSLSLSLSSTSNNSQSSNSFTIAFRLCKSSVDTLDGRSSSAKSSLKCAIIYTSSL